MHYYCTKFIQTITRTKLNLTNLYIDKIRIDTKSKIARKGPWRRCPCYKSCIMGIANYWERHNDFRVGYFLQNSEKVRNKMGSK